MKNFKPMKIGGAVALLLACTSTAQAVGETPYSFSLEGVLYDTPGGSTPLDDTNAKVRVQIVDATGNCVLYDESQFVNTHSSNGVFVIQVGSATGAAKRVGGSDPGNSMAAVFQNRVAIPATGGSCAGSSYTPAAGATRLARLIITPSATNVDDTLTPMMEIGAVPSALVANSLDGIARTGFLQVNGSANLSQSNLESIFTGGNYTTLTSLLGGGASSSSGNYAINAATGGTGGIDFNVNGTTRAGIANNGDFSVDSGSFFVQASSDRIGIGTSAPASSLDLSNKTDAIALPSGITGQRPSPALAGMLRYNSTLTAVEFYDGSGWVSLRSNITGITAGGDLSGTYPSPVVSQLLGRALDTTAPSAGQSLRYVSSKWTPANLGLADLVNSSNGSAVASAACSPGQTMYYNVTNKALECQSIAFSAPFGFTAPEVSSSRETLVTFRMNGDANTIGGIGNAIGANGTFEPMFYGFRPGSLSKQVTTVRGFTDAAGDVYGAENALVDISGVVTDSASDPLNGNSQNPSNRNILSVGSWNGPLMVVGPTGNVGIGTTNPTQPVDVIGNIRGSQTIIGNNFQDKFGCATFGNGSVGDNCAGSDFSIKASNTVHMTVKSGGNIGIGTSSPVTKLDVNGDAVVRGYIQAVSISAGNLSSMYNIVGGASTAGHWARIAHIEFDEQYQWWTGSFQLNSRLGINGKINLNLRQSNPMGGVPDVGVTVESPNGLYLDSSDVKVIVTDQTPDTPGTPVIKGLTTMELYVQLRYAYDALTYQPLAAGVVGFKSADYSPRAPVAPGALPAGAVTNAFGGAGWAPLGTLAQTYQGYVGIGTVNPGYPLHVVGAAGLSSGTAWTAASDIRLKDVHGDYEYGLDEVLKLHTIRFNYKKDNALNLPSDTPMTGFVAQEVQKVIPEAVHTRKDGYLELNVDPIHWAVVNAVKEFYAKWVSRDQEVAARMQALEAENRALKARLDRIERSIASH